MTQDPERRKHSQPNIQLRKTWAEPINVNAKQVLFVWQEGIGDIFTCEHEEVRWVPLELPELQMHNRVSTCSEGRCNQNGEFVPIKIFYVIPKMVSGRRSCLRKIINQ